MPLQLSDRLLDTLRADAPSTLIDLACRLYSIDEIAKPDATRLTGLSRVDFEAELTKRGLPWIRVNYDESYAAEFAAIRRSSDLAKQGG